MAIITTLKNAAKIVKIQKDEGRKTCLITGCFDVIHFGHIELFRFAKKYCDYLVIGLDNDKTISLSKGNNNPVFNFRIRSRVLAELKSIDLIFKIEQVFNFGEPNADNAHKNIIEKLKPDFLATHPLADKYWKKKRERAEKTGTKLLLYRGRRSSSSIVAKIRGEL